MEGRRSGQNAALLAQVLQGGPAPSLIDLEGPWMGLSGDEAGHAYAWALANIEYIVETDGMGDIARILDRIASGPSTEAALRDVLHSDYNDLTQSTADYLRKTYGR